LRKQANYLEKSFTLDHTNIYPRAALVLCRVALEELNMAEALLMESLKCPRFLKALHHVIETKGAVGHRLLSKLPAWLYSILFPTRHTDDDDEQDN
jgi:hypothetical protein